MASEESLWCPCDARLPGLRLPRKGKAELPDNFRAAFDIGVAVLSPSVFNNCFQHVLEWRGRAICLTMLIR
jgi:hypothetical protein